MIEALAAVARSRGDAARAVRLDAGAAALRETLGTPLAPVEERDWAAERAATAAMLGPDDYARFVREGAVLPLDKLVAQALDGEGE